MPSDTSRLCFTLLVGLVACERLWELYLSRRHGAWARARGGQEFGREHYPWMVLLHTGLLVGMLAEVWLIQRTAPPLALAAAALALSVVAMALRYWCIASLGPRWNTRVVCVPGLPLVHKGPYRWLSHPNYVAVVLEGIALPMVHGAWRTAVCFTLLNAWLLTVRIRVESAALQQMCAQPLPSA
ncbi:MAG: isoprenylcysteine carboxyl methyltransferase family protein [Polyangiales bacterium]